MSIQLLTAAKTAPAETGAKNAASGDQPEGKLSFSAVLADRRQAHGQDHSQTHGQADTRAANTARRPDQASAKHAAAPGGLAPQALAETQPDARKADQRLVLDGPNALAHGVAVSSVRACA